MDRKSTREELEVKAGEQSKGESGQEQSNPSKMISLLDGLVRAQNLFIKGKTSHQVFDGLLSAILEFSNSEYGYIGEVFHEDDGTSYQLSRAISNLAWDRDTRKYHADNWHSGLRFESNDTLFGSVTRTGQVVVANDVVNDPRSKGIPEGHPAIHTFLGIPIFFKDRIVGSFGLANRTGGYDSELIDSLRPFISTCSVIISSFKMDVERKKTETILGESEKYYQTVLDTINEGVILQSSSGKILTWNKGAEEIFGIAAQEVIGQTSEGTEWPTIHEDGSDYESKDHPSMRTLRTGKPCRNETMGIFGPNGELKWISVNTNPIFMDHEKAPHAVAISFSDITELKKGKDQFQTYLDIAGVILMALDENGTITLVNKKACKILESPKEDMLGRNWFDNFMPRELIDETKIIFRKLLSGDIDESKYVESEVITRTGKRKIIAWHNTVIKNDKNKIIGTLSSGEDITERRLAEIKIEKQADILNAVFNSTPNILVIVNEDGLIEKINRKGVEFSKRGESELIGLLGGEVFNCLNSFDGRGCSQHPECSNCPIRTRVDDTFDTGESHMEEEGHMTFLMDGKEIKLNLLISTILIESEGVRQVLISITDVTKLKETESYYRMMAEMLDEAPSAITIHDFDGKFLYANRKTFEIHGYNRNDFMDLNVRDVNVPESAELIDQRMREVLNKGETSFEAYRVHKDGSVLPMEVFAKLVDWKGQHALMSIASDVSEKKQSEEALRQSEEQFRNFFEHLTIGVSVYEAVNGGEDFVFFDMNPAGQRLSRVSIDEIRGKRLSRVFPGAKDLGLLQALQNVWRTGKPEYVPFKLYKDERIKQWVENRVFKLPSGRIVAVYDDQTERLHLEEGLRQAQKMESVGRLAGGVAHDFNNMLSVIMGRTDMLMEHAEPGKPLYAGLSEIKGAAQRSADVTRQLLAFARKQTIAPKVIDLNEVIENTLKMLRRLIGEDVDLSWLPGKQLWPVKVDPSQLDQILANLSVNARDAITRKGRLIIETDNIKVDKIYCDNHPGASPGDFVKLTVSDNGCGMDQETLENMFEPFYTTKEADKGTGLGLATVYGIVKQNDGYINVSSELSKGTSFEIFLPRHTAAGEQVHAREKAETVLRGSEAVLLVEDEVAILKMTKTMLEGIGYTVLAAGAPGKAIKLAREYNGEIHLLLTDVVMPEMNGQELLTSILQIYPNLKSLFMSGYTADVIAHHGVLEEGIYYIQKPFSRQELSVKLREVLDGNDS